MLFGIVDLGRGVYTYTTIDNAARQGARVASVNQIETSVDCDESRPIEDPSDPHWSIKTCAAAAATGLGVTTAQVTVSYFPPPGNALLTCLPTLHVGCIARVNVQHTFQPATPIVGNLVGPIAMSSTAEVPVERVFP
jgi:Flp pilus assembly protein TadG